MNWLQRLAIGSAGFAGLGGVAAAAASAHGGDQRLMGAAALVALAHAPALLVLGHARRTAWPDLAAIPFLAAGIGLFCGDMAIRQFGGTGLFGQAAPVGGISLMLGWLMVAISALTRPVSGGAQ